MSLIKTWFTPAEAEAKFGVSQTRIQEWVEAGLVRCEREGSNVVRVNIDDIALEAEAMVRESRE
jgi:predicted site-specific integrase-resolvase